MTSTLYAARKRGLTPHQHHALRAIGSYVEDPFMPAAYSDVSVITLRSLLAKGLIVYRDLRRRQHRWAPPGTPYNDFVLTDAGKALAEELGAWRP